MEIVEVANPTFHPEKWYYLEDHGFRIKDKLGNDRWRVLVEGRYFKFVSGNGYILKAHHVDKWHAFKANETFYSVNTDDRNFPTNYDDANGYFRSVWALVFSGNPNYYYVKNIRYPQHFLFIGNDNKVQLKRTDYGDQIQIKEIK